jgi:hypothetical protein
MPKRSSKQKETRELALSIRDQVVSDAAPPKEKNPAAVALGKLGGLKGGPARAAKLSAKKRQEIAKKAAKARWIKTTE